MWDNIDMKLFGKGKDKDKEKLCDMGPDDIKRAVADRYSKVASDPCAKFNFPVGRKFAESVGYPADLLDRLPAGFSESFTGAGNPQGHVKPSPGDILLDMGCGAGLDVYFYCEAVGETGKVYGLDISGDMLKKAASNLEAAGMHNFVPLEAPSDRVPLDDGSVDLVTANGIYNLSPDKDAVMREVFRVLKPGGRTVFAEIVLKAELGARERTYIDDWFRCIGGALVVDDFLDRMRACGFVEPTVLTSGRNARTGHKSAICAVIEARKPA